MEGGGKGKKRQGRDLPNDDISLVWWLCKDSGPIRIRCSKISKKNHSRCIIFDELRPIQTRDAYISTLLLTDEFTDDNVD